MYGIKYIRYNGTNLYVYWKARTLKTDTKRWQWCGEKDTKICEKGWHAFRDYEGSLDKANHFTALAKRCFLVEIKGKIKLKDPTAIELYKYHKFCGKHIRVLMEIPLGSDKAWLRFMFKQYCPKAYKKLHGYPACLK